MSIGRDPVTGVETTGHEWDGIKELATPVPWPARWALRLTIAFSILYWILFPGWPLLNDFTRGVLGYNSREAVLESVRAGADARAEMTRAFAEGEIEEIVSDQYRKNRYGAAIDILYLDNCAACHGRDLTGQTGFPDLTDGNWLWSGEPAEIELTLRYGINDTHPDTRFAQMLAFGTDQLLSGAEIADVTEFVLSLSGRAEDPAAAARGKSVFSDSCASCHGEDGQGGLGVGAPALGDTAWIYGGTREQITETVKRGRMGVMPAWEDRLTAEEIRMLTAYVTWASREARDAK